MWSLSLVVHPHAEKCLPWTNVKGLCVLELPVCTAQVLLRTSWEGTWLKWLKHVSTALFCKGQMHWKLGDSWDNGYFQNWLPGLLEPNTDVQICFSFFLEIFAVQKDLCLGGKDKGCKWGEWNLPLQNTSQLILLRCNTRNEHLRSEGHLFREEGRKHCSIQKLCCVSAECREHWLLLHKHLSAGREGSTAWKTEAPWLLTSFCYSWMSSALKASFHFGDIWEHQSSFPVPLNANCVPVQAHNTTWSEQRLSPGSTAASQGQTFPLAASFPVASHFETAVKDEPKGAVHSCFPWGCTPGATSDSNVCLSSSPEFEYPDCCIYVLDSIFCFPKKQNSPENDCFISSVTQIRKEIFF